MKIRLSIHFQTVWGQCVYVVGSLPELGAWDVSLAKAMYHTGEGNWILELDLPDKQVAFEYRYFLASGSQLLLEEWQRNHRQNICDTRQDYILVDYWQNQPHNPAMYSSAFCNGWFSRFCDKSEYTVKSDRKLCLKLLAPDTKRNQSIALTGNQDILGNWEIGNALIMTCNNFSEWSIELDANTLSNPLEFKFCIVENDSKSLIEWEEGDNRVLTVLPVKDGETIIVSGLQYRKNSTEWKCAGTAVPVFSLRSKNSFGIGDFGDLKKCIDWLKLTSQKILQILPINDTTKTHTRADSYPYNAISIFALHPLYLNLDEMGELNNAERKVFYKEKQSILNSLEEVDYEQVDIYKRMFFRELFAQEGNMTLQSPEFSLFYENNKEWLIPYAAYSYLRDKYHSCNFHLWKEYSKYNKDAIERLCQPDKAHYPEIALYYYLQYHLHKQLSEARDYAHSKGIVLKGDIPIGISITSIEAWTEPELFNFRYQTGAPPDDFSIEGQNWGFPTYNWEQMEADRYKWWKRRFRKLMDYFDVIRIDHILGFFRIWEIPRHSVQALSGWFSPALPFSEEEIKKSGFNFQLERYVNAHINERFLPELFGDYTQEVTQIYLNRISSTYFSLKEPFNTQLKIYTYFSGKEDSKSRIIRKGLFTICTEVLFVRDKRQPDRYHPRISAHNSFVHKELDYIDRDAFDYLYRHYFYGRHDDFWKEQGYKKLVKIVAGADMLVCGEDLGMIPHCVPEVMQKLNILSLEIERMPKESNREFTDLNHLPYLSVCSTSTHDMPTLRMEWKENPEKTQRYYNKILKREGTAPDDCAPDVCEQIIFNHLNARSMLAIIPLQDWFSLDGEIRNENESGERINTPSNPNNYWKYRIHLHLETLLGADKFNEKIIRLIGQTQRRQDFN